MKRKVMILSITSLVVISSLLIVHYAFYMKSKDKSSLIQRYEQEEEEAISLYYENKTFFEQFALDIVEQQGGLIYTLTTSGWQAVLVLIRINTNNYCKAL